MKYLLSFLFLFGLGLSSYGQAHVSSSGISIQGIARDANNAAQTNISQLSLDFKIYYLGAGNSEELIHQESGNVSTDDFGVFSYVIDISNDKYVRIANKEAYLKVEQGGVVFSNEKLQTVPYAIHAQNGVPTGSIMPFIGGSSDVPPGWLLCNGASFPDDVYHAKLKALLGSNNTPNLAGAYLRGVGTSGSHAGPSLKGFQQDQVKQHSHSVSLSGNTNNDGAHRHNLPMDSQGGGGTRQTLYDSSGYDERWVDQGSEIEAQSNHRHSLTISGNTNNTGSSEARVYGYGVNYIIKI